MRKRRKQHGLTVNAIAGSHVVLLGLDLDPAQCPGCLGFAIQREDHTENERAWLKGMKTFQATDPHLGPGGRVSSREHPFQTFQWADYSAKPAHDYTYTVLPLYGQPAALTEGAAVAVGIRTEQEVGGRHSVFFNRGAIASQEYARRFQNQPPDQVGEPAYKWLSRGLLEALLAFIARADSDDYALCGAIYELQWPGVLAALKAAAVAGAEVKVLYDAIPGASGPGSKNAQAIAAAQIEALCVPRTTGKLMHNKFFVLVKNGQPVAVWTGSTNLTENGIFGHANCGHLVEDPAIAAAYKAYWDELQGNPQADAERAWVATNNPAPPDPWVADTTVVFSPRQGLRVLEWYAAIAGTLLDQARRPLFMTFAFGMHKDFQVVYELPDGVLRLALMEKEGNGRGLAKGKADIRRISALPNVIVAVAANITTNSFDRWREELPGLPNAHVKYIHTKYMLVDPLGPHPIVVTGSANFSEPSTDTNQENMLIIRDDQRVADIYLGEFMRGYSHYAFREAAAIWKHTHPSVPWTPNFLLPDDTWLPPYRTLGTDRSLRRLYFAGP
jgi:phosphatidylserine/phosphatidylglycerophosphate/cardiolipin synthase-like enzyme